MPNALENTRLVYNKENNEHSVQEESNKGTNLIERIMIPESVESNHMERDLPAARKTLLNFILLSVLFSANHGGVVSCLSLATARLGSLGAWQSVSLYLSYTLSALLGATYVVKTFGSRDALLAGMSMYCVYVGCFAFATAIPSTKVAASIVGGIIGGFGAGFLWTAQGSYFARAAEQYAIQKGSTVEDSTSLFGGIFAGIYLSEEVLLRLFSSIMAKTLNWSWKRIFSGYTMIAVLSTLFMLSVHKYPLTEKEMRKNEQSSPFEKVTVVGKLLISDRKMKYMIPLNAVFGFSAAFITSFVNGEVIRVVLSDQNSTDIGFLTALTSCVAAVLSVVLGFVAQKIGRGPILILGSISFFMVGFLFAIRPSLLDWGVASLALVYIFQGIGRATFEGTLRAEFAIMFAEEKEGAFGNIIFQNGMMSAVGYFMSINLPRCTQGNYCIEFTDGSYHNMIIFEMVIMISAVLAIFGYWRASVIHSQEIEEEELRCESYRENEGHLL